MIDADRLALEAVFTAVRGGGPGGQNVNKVSSAAMMTWDFKASAMLSEEQKALIEEKLQGNINRDGMMYVRSEEFRDLERNKARCIEKVLERLKIAFHRPKPRKATRPSYSSQRKRMDSKSRRGDIKKMRRKERF